MGERHDADSERKRQTKLERVRRRGRRAECLSRDTRGSRVNELKIKHCLALLLQCLQKGAHKRDEQRNIHIPCVTNIKISTLSVATPSHQIESLETHVVCI